MSSKKAKQIKKDDYCRVLITETLPYETPIIFSNDGLYDKILNIESMHSIQQTLIKNLVFGENGANVHSSIPYLYKIRKDSNSYRRLALLHPRSQWKIKEFYEKYEALILYYCSLSPATIRAPRKVAGSFYTKSSIENLRQYKEGAIALEGIDELTKHSPSFYSYKGYNRLYKFFESVDYFELEKSYASMLTLDVSKCFDSIYTHTMSWAVKDKEFTKKFVEVNSTFGQEFDRLMMHANHNETNGIVIGPEISRIFAEIIFQDIDVKCINKIQNKLSLTFNKEYAFRRYVDDLFIFASTKEHAQKIYNVYADILMSFNLHANGSKSIYLNRPFVTNKSRLVHAASIEINNFIDKFLEIKVVGNLLTPKHIRSTWNLTRSFIECIKTLCSYNAVNYDEIASFTIAVLTERIKKIVAIKKIDDLESTQLDYKNAFIVLLDVLYFFYKISPSVGGSYKLCTSIILIVRFTKKHLKTAQETLAQKIYELSLTLLSGEKSEGAAIDGFIPLEVLNVILSIKELGKNYLIPQETVDFMFIGIAEHSYFSIVSGFFYMKNEPEYKVIKDKLIDMADAKLMDLADIRMNSEKAYLLLDLITCPYIPEKKKLSWVNRAYKGLGLAKPLKTDVINYFSVSLKSHIQVNWDDEVDLLNSLEKKELKQAY